MQARLIGNLRRDEWRPDVTGADGVAGNAKFGHFQRHAFRQAHHGMFRRHIGTLEG
ncbi:hypothetical protein D3C80_2026560 [compost metagenome]